MEFIVNWSIDIDAEGPIDAAEKVREILLDPENTASAFEVVDETGKRFAVDLLDDDPIEAREL